MLKIFTIFLVLSELSFCVFSQGTVVAVANTSVSATVVEPVTVNSDLGSMAVIIAGTVDITPVQSNTTLGIFSLPVANGSFTAATFYLSGSAGYNFTINVPRSQLTIINGTNKMKVTSFTSEPSLNAGPGMIAGVYVSVSQKNVIVNYN